MKKTKAVDIIGKCPHCGGEFGYTHEMWDRIAEASCEAVERVALKRDGSGRVVTLMIGPSYSTF